MFTIQWLTWCLVPWSTDLYPVVVPNIHLLFYSFSVSVHVILIYSLFYSFILTAISRRNPYPGSTTWSTSLQRSLASMHIDCEHVVWLIGRIFLLIQQYILWRKICVRLLCLNGKEMVHIVIHYYIDEWFDQALHVRMVKNLIRDLGAAQHK